MRRRSLTLETIVRFLYLFLALLSLSEVIGSDNRILTVPSPFTEIDENFVLLSILAAELSAAVNDEDTVEGLPLSSSWINEPDKAILVRIDNLCWIAFRATTWSVDDWAQNLNPNMAKDVCFYNECCESRQGFRDAYIEVNYLDDLESSLEDCVIECCQDPENCDDGEECDVVLTGTSQGAAVAHVAAVYLQAYNPTTITFAQPPTMKDPCNAIDADRLYRFVNTINVGNDLKYDPIPFLDFGGTDPMGHLFVLGEDSKGVAYYKDHEAPDVTLSDWTKLNVQSAHSIDSHIEKLQTFLDEGDFPLGMDGWDIDHLCTRYTECVSPHICSRGRCSNGQVGEDCWYESDCLDENTCEGVFSPVCKAKRNNGSYCNEDDDCKSDECDWTWRGWKCG
jgi:hypothetical protein